MIKNENMRNSELILNGCSELSLNGHRPMKVGEDKGIICQSQIKVFITIWETIYNVFQSKGTIFR
jgi:hypothetical protein